MPSGDPNAASGKADYIKKSNALQAVYKLAENVLVAVLPPDEASQVRWEPLDAEGRAQGLQANPLTRESPAATRHAPTTRRRSSTPRPICCTAGWVAWASRST